MKWIFFWGSSKWACYKLRSLHLVGSSSWQKSWRDLWQVTATLISTTQEEFFIRVLTMIATSLKYICPPPPSPLHSLNLVTFLHFPSLSFYADSMVGSDINSISKVFCSPCQLCNLQQVWGKVLHVFSRETQEPQQWPGVTQCRRSQSNP